MKIYQSEKYAGDVFFCVCGINYVKKKVNVFPAKKNKEILSI